MFPRLLPILFLAADAFAEFRPRTPAFSDVLVGSYAGRRIAYELVGGYAVSDGDILIGTVSNTKAPAAGLVSRTGSLWTGGVVPYVIDPGVTQPAQITTAMAEWSAKTPITFVQRTNQANYLKFVRPPAAFACNSYVGMIGGEQVVNVGDSCGAVGVLHEIGHAIGMWHEQSRNDRDDFLRISYSEVQLSCAFNFDRFAQTGREVGPYDFGSLMQYYPYAFSRTGLPTMETSPAGIPIGDVTGVSALDADAVSRMYGRVARSTTVSTFPAGLQVLVDGVPITRTTQFDWADGSTHTISVPDTQGDARVRYAFGRWSDGGARQHTVTAAADSRVFTVFLVRQHRTTITARTGGRVAVTPPSPDGFYNERTFVTMTATADAGSSFLSWDNLDVDETGRLTFIYSNNYYGFGPQNPRTFEVNRARDITVTFTTQPTVTIQTDPPNLRFRLDGNELLAPMVLTASRFSANQPHTLAAAAQQDCRTQCITGTRYLFRDWTDAPAATQTVTWDGRGNATYTVRYRTQHQLTVLSGNTTRGTVRAEPAPTDGYHDEGDAIKLTATPTATNRFTGWQSGLLSVDLTAPDSANIVASCGNPWMYRINQPLTLFGYFDVPVTGATRPAITAAGVTNAASAQGGIAAGTILVLYGSNLGPSGLAVQSASDSGFFDNCFADTAVTFDGTPAPVIYTSAGQLSAIAPYSIEGKSTASVVVSYRGLAGNAVPVPVQRTAPALFTSNLTGAGQAAMFNEDGSINGSANPASRGSIVVLFATGEGQTNPAGVDGQLALATYPKPNGAVSLRIGGVEAEILYAGAAPTLVAGVLQVNARVPGSIVAGAVPVILTVGGTSSRSDVTLAVR